MGGAVGLTSFIAFRGINLLNEFLLRAKALLLPSPVAISSIVCCEKAFSGGSRRKKGLARTGVE